MGYPHQASIVMSGKKLSLQFEKNYAFYAVITNCLNALVVINTVTFIQFNQLAQSIELQVNWNDNSAGKLKPARFSFSEF